MLDPTATCAEVTDLVLTNGAQSVLMLREKEVPALQKTGVSRLFVGLLKKWPCWNIENIVGKKDLLFFWFNWLCQKELFGCVCFNWSF